MTLNPTSRFNWRLAAPILALTLLAQPGCSKESQERSRQFVESGKRFVAQNRLEHAELEFKNATQAWLRNPEAHYQLALVQLAMGKTDAAEDSLQWATRIDPTHLDAQFKFCELQATTPNSDIREAERRMTEVLKIRSKDPDALQVMGLLEYRLGKNKSATEHVTAALEERPKHLKSWITLAAIRVAERQFDQAKWLLIEAALSAPGSAEPSLALARLHLAQGNPEEAASAWNQALSIDPQNATALIGLAQQYIRAGKLDSAEQILRRVSARPEEAYQVLHADFLLQVGKRDEAIAELEALAQKTPSSRLVRQHLAGAYIQADRSKQAEALLTTALDRDKADLDAREQRAEIFAATGRLNEAEADIQKVLRMRFRSGKAHLVMARIHLARGRARTHAQELALAVEYDPSLLPARLELSEALRSSNSLTAARDLLDRAPEEQKLAQATIIERNWIALAMGDIPLATQGVEKGKALGASWALAFQEGLIKLRRNEIGAARASLEQALVLKPEDPRVLDTIAASYRMEGKAAAGVERIRRYAAEHNRAPIQQLLGEWLEQQGDLVGARQAYQAAIALNKASGAPRLSLARLEMAQGRWDSARAMLAEMAALLPGDPGLLLAQGMLEEGVGNAAAAISHYRRVLTEQPDHAVALNNLAVLLGENPKTLDEALALAEKVQELLPSNLAVNDTIGWIYYKKGIYQTAVKYLTAAAAPKDSARVHYHLAMAHFMEGNSKAGRAALEIAQQIDPSLPEARAAAALASTR